MKRNKITRREFLKGLAIAGAGTMGASVLASCVPQPPPAPAATVTAAAPATAAAPVELREGLCWVSIPEMHKAEENLVARFNEQNPGIKVTWEDYDPEKFLVQSAAGAAPDVVLGPVPSWGPAGGVLDLMPYAKGEPGFLEDFAEVPIKENTWRGKLFWIPNATITWNILYYNIELFEKAGLDLPDIEKNWTWDYFLECCQKLTVKEGDQVKQMGYSNWWDPAMNGIWVESNHGRWFKEDMTEVMFDKTEAVEGLQFLTDLVHKYNVAPKEEQAAAVSGKAYEMVGFVNQQIAMVHSGTWEMSILKDAKFRFGFSLVPVSRKDYLGERICYIGSGFCFAIAASTKHPDEAWQVVKFVSSKEAQLARPWNFPARKSAIAALQANPPEQYWPKDLMDAMAGMVQSPQAAMCPTRHVEWDADFGTAFGKYWDMLKLGQISAKEAMEKAAAECNPLLKKWAEK